MSTPELIEYLKLEQAAAVMSEIFYANSKRQRKMELTLEIKTLLRVISRTSTIFLMLMKTW